MTTIELAEFEKRLREVELNELRLFEMGQIEAPTLYRSIGYHIQEKAEHLGDGMWFVATEESEDRMGDVISIAGWELGNFKRNPVFLFIHNHGIPPIGIVSETRFDGKQMLARVEFDTVDPLAQLVEGKFKRKVMNAVSVGFRPIEFEERESKNNLFGRGILFLKQELLEISAVPIPAHPKALLKAIDAVKYSMVVPELYTPAGVAITPHDITTITNGTETATFDFGSSNTTMGAFDISDDVQASKLVTSGYMQITSESLEDQVEKIVKRIMSKSNPDEEAEYVNDGEKSNVKILESSDEDQNGLSEDEFDRVSNALRSITSEILMEAN